MTEKVCIVGLGYVGLPLALALGKKMPCMGFDINERRVEQLTSSYDSNMEHEEAEFRASEVSFSSQPSSISSCSCYIVTVPTPIDGNNQPDLSAIRGSCELVGSILKKGDLVVFESTVYPGCTEDFCGPILEAKSGLKAGTDFNLGYSPERINPGDKTNRLESIVKVVSGDTPASLERVSGIYESVIDAGVYRAESIKVAEAAKLTENIQRDVNIALMNELSEVYSKLGIRTNRVLEAARTKWNFIPFRPGMVGGHCIGVDPYYLIDAAAKNDIPTPLLSSARQVNEAVVGRVISYFKDNVEQVVGRTLVLGVTFKEDCNDLRNSKAFELSQALSKLTEVHVYEPNVDDTLAAEFEHVNSFSRVPYDCIIVAVPHKQFATISEQDLRSLLVEDGVLMDIHDLYKSTEKRGFWL